VMCLTVSSLYRLFRPDPSIACGTECAAQLMLVLSLGCVLSYPLAKVGFPYRDAGLNAADIWMGLDWRAYLHFFNDRPLLGTLARLIYDSVFVQFLILIASLAAPSRLLRLQQYIFATALALVVTLAVFTFVPAGGIYTFLAISPDEFANLSPVMSTDQIIYLDAIRSGEHTLVSSLAGLVTFPSFHATWAILFIRGFYPIRRLRYGAILLNLFMLVITPIQGAHYFIDLVGGVVVAAAAIYVAVRFMPGREQTSHTQDILVVQKASGMTTSIKMDDQGPARSLGGACL